MTTKLPVTAGQYRIVKNHNIPPEGLRSEGPRPDEQAVVLVAVPRSRLDERLVALIAGGKVAVSTVVSKYQELVSKFSGE
jgi:hypothetical protein